MQTQPDGTSNGTFRSLPALHTAILRKALDACASPRRTNPVLDDGTGDTALPYSSRLGRAFCELLEHLPADGLPQHGASNASIVVTVDETRLRAGAGEAGSVATGGVSPAMPVPFSRESKLRTSPSAADVYPAAGAVRRQRMAASMNASMSPSSTAEGLPSSWSVRRSLTIWYGFST